MKRIIHLLYLVVALIYVIAYSYENNLITTITKPIPVLLLIFLIKRNSVYNQLIIIGLVFSLLGDIFLMRTVNFFILGLVAFLIAHLFYIFAYLERTNKLKLTSYIPFLLYAILFFMFIFDSLGDMAIPVAVYMFIISTMLWRSFVQRKTTPVAKWAFIGAFVFTISDSMIAISKFYEPFFMDSFFIMFTYWTAQFLIYQSTNPDAIDS